jgi:hypothetical protein
VSAQIDTLADFDSSDGHLDTCWRDGQCDCALRLYRLARTLDNRESGEPGADDRPCRSGDTDCTVDCGWCKGAGREVRRG